MIVARHEVPGLEFGHFDDRFQGAVRSVARAIGEEESKKVNEAQRTAKQLGGMTHQLNGGRPGGVRHLAEPKVA